MNHFLSCAFIDKLQPYDVMYHNTIQEEDPHNVPIFDFLLSKPLELQVKHISVHYKWFTLQYRLQQISHVFTRLDPEVHYTLHYLVPLTTLMSIFPVGQLYSTIFHLSPSIPINFPILRTITTLGAYRKTTLYFKKMCIIFYTYCVSYMCMCVYTLIYIDTHYIYIHYIYSFSHIFHIYIYMDNNFKMFAEILPNYTNY